jgi:hypothetical protein
VSTKTTKNTLTTELADQLDYHWTQQLRPRLDGLTDDEYFWRPVPDCWTVHPDGSIDFTYPPPDPAPFTTIAWRLAHVIVGVLAVRNHAHFGGPEASYVTWQYATDAATAMRQLDDEYTRWIDGVRGLSDDDLNRPCGPAEGEWADHRISELILHINREVIHHGAEIACIRDLYAHTTDKKGS